MNTTQTRADNGEEEASTSGGGVTVLCERLHQETRDPDEIDRIYDSLSNHRRRQMLHLLEADSDQSSTVPDLASTIAAQELDIDCPDTVGYDERKSVQSSIYQHHAPKMADAGLVEFDKRTSRLELADRAACLRLTGDDTDTAGSASDDRGWPSPDVTTAVGAAVMAVCVAATATVAGPATVFAVLATSAVTGIAVRVRSNP